MKSFLLIITLISLSNASMLLDKKNLCIEDYYVTNDGYFHYLKSNTGKWNKTSYKNYSQSVLYGYKYDSNDNSCRKNKSNQLASDLGLDYFDFNMLLALSAILFSSIVVFFLTSFLVSF